MGDPALPSPTDYTVELENQPSAFLVSVRIFSKPPRHTRNTSAETDSAHSETTLSSKDYDPATRSSDTSELEKSPDFSEDAR